MTDRPVLIDAFCGAGGATEGYRRAGFYVVGIDIEPQPHYCGDEFHQFNALEVLANVNWDCSPIPVLADAIHASPPCQAHTTMSNRWRGSGGKADDRVNLLTPTLKLLAKTNVPWIVENVVGARALMPESITLHGGMFGLGVHRPRLFAANFLLWAHDPAPAPKNPLGVYGKAHDGRLLWRRSDGTEQRAARTLEEAQTAMGMPWGDWHGVKEAIPPAYTEWLGGQLMAQVEARSAPLSWWDRCEEVLAGVRRRDR